MLHRLPGGLENLSTKSIDLTITGSPINCLRISPVLSVVCRNSRVSVANPIIPHQKGLKCVTRITKDYQSTPKKTMSYIGGASDVEQEKNLTEFRRNRSNASLVYKQHTDHRDDSDSEISDSGNFLAKGKQSLIPPISPCCP